MRWSDERILTTHTGSLPRPPELTRLYVQRARGGAVDPAELDRLGKEALRQIVEKQVEAGVDIGNNGEQQREAFFLYVRHRMSGFGSTDVYGASRVPRPPARMTARTSVVVEAGSPAARPSCGPAASAISPSSPGARARVPERRSCAARGGTAGPSSDEPTRCP